LVDGGNQEQLNDVEVTDLTNLTSSSPSPFGPGRRALFTSQRLQQHAAQCRNSRSNVCRNYTAIAISYQCSQNYSSHSSMNSNNTSPSFNGCSSGTPGLSGSPWFSSYTCSRKEPLGIRGADFFTSQIPFLSPNQQCQSTEGTFKDWSQPVASSHPLLNHHCIIEVLLPVHRLSDIDSQ